MHDHTAIVSGSGDVLSGVLELLSPSGKDSWPSVHSGTLIPLPGKSCLEIFHGIGCSL